MPPQLKAVPQMAMDEHVIDDREIEEALDERQKRKNSLDAVRLSYDDADERAKALCAHDADEQVVAARSHFSKTERLATPDQLTLAGRPKSGFRVLYRGVEVSFERQGQATHPDKGGSEVDFRDVDAYRKQVGA